MSNFVCEICNKEYPDVILNEHHYDPKEYGGLDIKENLRNLDPGCHHVLHYISYCIIRNDGKAEQTAYSYAEGIDPKNSRIIAKRLIKYATNVAEFIKRSKYLDKSGSQKRVYFSLKDEYKQLLNDTAKRSCLSRERYLQILIYQDLISKYSFLKKELNNEIIHLMSGI